MTKQNYETIIDFGSSKIRLLIFDKKNVNQKIFIEKNCVNKLNIKNFNIEDSYQIVDQIIKQAEKKINNHVNHANVIIDSHDIFSIDISIKRKLEGKILKKDDLNYAVQEAKQLIQSNNQDKKIIHIILQNINIDNVSYKTFPSENLNCNILSIELKFICFPKSMHENIINIFKKSDILINKFFSSSYVKTSGYCNLIKNFDIKVFLDIGYEKTCICIYNNEKLIYFKIIPVGGNHITKDISKIFKINEIEAEKIKKTLNQSELILADEVQTDFEIKIKNFNKEQIDLLQKVIYARVNEILELCFENLNKFNPYKKEKKSILILTGSGSKILNKNSIYLNSELNQFDELFFFEETQETMMESLQNYLLNSNLHDVNFVPKRHKKKGFFEKLFQFFD